MAIGQLSKVNFMSDTLYKNVQRFIQMWVEYPKIALRREAILQYTQVKVKISHPRNY